MSTSPARVAAFEILLRVEQQDAFASDLLHSPHYEKLSAADHRLATELVMGVLRWRSLLDEQIANHSSLKLVKLDLQVLTSLRLATYQLIFLNRIPARAAIYESVELVKRARKRSAVPYVNALLRKLAASKPQAPAPSAFAKTQTASDLAAISAHPQWLVDRWVQQFGIDAARKICGYDQRVPETSFSADPAALQAIEDHGIKLGPGRLLASSRRLVAGNLANIPPPLLRQIAIQDEGSRLVALLLSAGSLILDCCAAPGGKTRTLAERNPSATIVAAELHPHRARLLRNLVIGQNVRVITADARTLPTVAQFDRVLVDVPCSGTGTLARNPEIKWRLQAADLCDLQSRQLAILLSAMQHVASGGELVYSTCSLEKEENQDVLEKALSAEGSFQLLDCRVRLQQLRAEGELVWDDVGSLTDGLFLRTLPGIHPCDGFFAAILKKL